MQQKVQKDIILLVAIQTGFNTFTQINHDVISALAITETKMVAAANQKQQITYVLPCAIFNFLCRTPSWEVFLTLGWKLFCILLHYWQTCLSWMNFIEWRERWFMVKKYGKVRVCFLKLVLVLITAKPLKLSCCQHN